MVWPMIETMTVAWSGTMTAWLTSIRFCRETSVLLDDLHEQLDSTGYDFFGLPVVCIYAGWRHTRNVAPSQQTDFQGVTALMAGGSRSTTHFSKDGVLTRRTKMKSFVDAYVPHERAVADLAQHMTLLQRRLLTSLRVDSVQYRWS